MRMVCGRVLGLAGIAAYNWWVVAALDRRLVNSMNELFSDLEATGRSASRTLGRLDVAAGVLIALALLARGRQGPAGPRPEWAWLVGFAAASAIGGLFPYACPEGLSAACRGAEWRLQLPIGHYVHVVSGIAEFACATVAVWLAWRRTAGRRTAGGGTAVARTVTAVGWVLVLAYPLLAASYLTDRLGVLVEPVFFVGFSAMVVVELYERAAVPELETELAGR